MRSDPADEADSAVSGGVLLLGVVGACLGLACVHPGLGVAAALFATPVLVRTFQRVAAEPAERRSARLYLVACLSSAVLTINCLLAGCVAFTLTCTVGMIPLISGMPTPTGLDYLPLVLFLSVVAGLFGMGRVVRRQWFHGFPRTTPQHPPTAAEPAE